MIFIYLQAAANGPRSFKPIEGKQTIPRLELAGLVLAAHQVPYLTKAWNLPNNFGFHLWCDAKVVLDWLKKRNITDTYVNNRVKQVRDLCEDHWESIKIHYVPTEQNPADIITRQQKAEEFITNSTWWDGPEWLLEEKSWPQTDQEYCLYPDGKPTKTTSAKVATNKFSNNSVNSLPQGQLSYKHKNHSIWLTEPS